MNDSTNRDANRKGQKGTEKNGFRTKGMFRGKYKQEKGDHAQMGRVRKTKEKKKRNQEKALEDPRTAYSKTMEKKEREQWGLFKLPGGGDVNKKAGQKTEKGIEAGASLPTAKNQGTQQNKKKKERETRKK